MVPLTYIFELVTGKTTLKNSDLFYVIVFYIIAVIVMLLYELISTKRIKNVIRSFPSIGILVIINILIILLLNGFYKSQLNFNPSPSDVKYIVVSNSNTNTNVNSELDYFENGLSDKKITNTKLIDLLLENLGKNIEYEKNSYPIGSQNSINYNVITSSTQVNGTSSKQQTSKNVTVGFKTGLTIKYRMLYLDMETYEKYSALLLSSEDIKDLYMNLPAYNKNLMSFNNKLTAKENEDIYTTLKEEIKGLDYNLWYSLLYEKNDVINLNWTYNVNDKTTSTRLPLTSYTPKALLKYTNYMNKSVEAPKIMEDIQKILDGDFSMYNINIQNYGSDFTEYLDNISFINKNKISDHKESVQKLYNAINTNYLTTMDSITKDGQIFVKLDIALQTVNNSMSSYDKYYSIYTYIDTASFEELKNMQ